jgi:hypothetical protein
MRADARAVLIGVATVALGRGVRAGLTGEAGLGALRTVLDLLTPLAAAGLTAWWAPSRKVVMGLLMAPVTAVIAGMFTGLQVLLSPVHGDLPPGQYAVVAGVTWLAYSLAPALVGGVGGFWLSRSRSGRPPGGVPEVHDRDAPR